MTLNVKNLTAGYGKITVLRNITIKVQEGQILGILGRNGMGKTTLIRSLCGLIPVNSGSIKLYGDELCSLPPHKRALKGITTVVQGRGIFPGLTVSENLEMGRIASGKKKQSRIEEVFHYFPILSERVNQPAGTLSGGEQQMLAIGRGLMTDPKVLLLDEPSEGIMPILVQQIAKVLSKINITDKMMIIIVEQNLPMVFSMTDQCIIIENGQVVLEGNRKEIENSDVMKKYLAI